MSEQDMTLARLKELVASYGADPKRWPDDERKAALDFMAGQAEAADITGQADALDRLLASLPAPAPASAALKDRLEAVSALPHGKTIVPVRPANRGGYALLAGFFGPLSGAATARALIPQAAALTMICLAGGVALGLSDFAVAEEQAPDIDPSAYFFGDPGLDQDLEELD